MLLYALLFLNDREKNPFHLSVKKLRVIYADQEVNVEIPSDADRVSLTTELNERAIRAQFAVSVVPPEARPDSEACTFCAVRQLCPEYWTPDGQALVGASTVQEGMIDAEVRLHEKYSNVGWRASVVTCAGLKVGSQVLVRCSRENESLLAIMETLVRGRLLTVQLIPAPQDDASCLPVLHLTRASEVFSVQ